MSRSPTCKFTSFLDQFVIELLPKLNITNLYLDSSGNQKHFLQLPECFSLLVLKLPGSLSPFPGLVILIRDQVSRNQNRKGRSLVGHSLPQIRGNRCPFDPCRGPPLFSSLAGFDDFDDWFHFWKQGIFRWFLAPGGPTHQTFEQQTANEAGPPQQEGRRQRRVGHGVSSSRSQPHFERKSARWMLEGCS